MGMTRRDMLKTTAVGAAAVAMSGTATKAEASGHGHMLAPAPKGNRVVVCGGGFGGLTTAKYVMKRSGGKAEVILIDQRMNFVSCPFSNTWLGGVEGSTLEKLSADFYGAAEANGYTFLHATITGIDRKSRTVTTNKGTVGYDLLVLAPGIDYDYSTIPGIGKDAAKARRVFQNCPPAMRPGSEHIALKRQLEEMEEGNFVITVPTGKYRCPPAPYERAAMVAWYMKKNDIPGKVVILNPTAKLRAKHAGFMNSYKKYYDNIQVEFNTSIHDVDVDNKVITYMQEGKKKTVKYAAATINPTNKAGALTTMAGIETKPGGWALLEEPGFQSVTDDRIYVVGDAQGQYKYPPSGFMANSCAKVMSGHIAQRLMKKEVELTKEMPNNICFSMVNGDPKSGIMVTHTVKYDEVEGIKVSAKATSEPDESTGRATVEWFDGIMRDLFS